jgi:DNA invertase Pin-like site-specific DNA recombinase
VTISDDAQVKQLRDAGAEKVFREPASGARSDRAQLRRALDQLGKGDVLMVTRLERLARSTRDLLNTVAAIAAKKAGFRSLGDTWADTTTAHGRLMLAVLGGLAEFERELINDRHRRRPRTRQGARDEDGKEAETHPAPDARGDQTPRRQGRASARDCPHLQCFSQHDFTASRLRFASCH